MSGIEAPKYKGEKNYAQNLTLNLRDNSHKKKTYEGEDRCNKLKIVLPSQSHPSLG